MVDVTALVVEYDANYESYKITEKQIAYIKTLIEEVYNPEEKEKYLNIDLISLDKVQIFNLIKELKKIIPANMLYLTSLYHRFSGWHIKKLLKKEDGDAIITQYDAELILKTPDKFSLWLKEHPIRSEEHWEYGWQENSAFTDGKMEYLKFYDMMMLDYDNFEYDELISHLKGFVNHRFRIYKTYAGFHVFITSDIIPYNSDYSKDISKYLLSDIHYNIFCSKTGYKIRLSPKLGRTEIKLCEYITDLGTVPTNELCSYLIKVHDKFFGII
jgi:hypothetical protein